MKSLFAPLLLLGLLWGVTEQGKISVDPSAILSFENQMVLYAYTILSHLDHLATDNFKLKLSPKAFEKLNFLDNITSVGVSYEGLTQLPDYDLISQEAFEKIDTNLSDASLFLLKALSKKNLEIPMVLQPSDDNLPETLNFMDAFKKYWRYVDRVASMQVEKLDPQDIPANVKEILDERTKEYDSKFARKGRKFLAPELPLQISVDHLRFLLSDVLIKPRNHATEEGAAEKVLVRAFITKVFEEFGLNVYNHEFSAHETHYLYGEQVIGTNIVGILPGERWGTPDDTPLIIGAHYDTVPNTTGTIDNASGTSAVIETARMLTSSECQFKNSIFFVAFDLEEIGTQGSFMFVKDFLLKLLFPTYGIKEIGGAIILDCLGNWDTGNGTQEVPAAWEEKVEGLKRRIEGRDNAGDFLAVMYRERPDSVLAERLRHYYNGLGEPEYALELMSLKELRTSRPNDTINFENFDFFRSDHYRFWYPSQETPNVSFPALLLTDTGPYRGQMSTCYHASCDTMEMMKPDIGFLSKVTQAAAWVVADLALGVCGPKGMFRVPEMFLVAQERQNIEHGQDEDDARPIVTLDGVIEILKYLGRTNWGNLEDMKGKNTNSSVLFKTPVHRFHVVTKNKTTSSPKKERSFSKLTITIHGKNSTYLIPLKIANPMPEGEELEVTTLSPITKESQPATGNIIQKNITASLKET